jgi:glycerophosphoryl diester phosphodiesterase
MLALTAGLLLSTAGTAVAAPIVAGHRGATGVPNYPEETLKAIGYAAAHGAAWVEGDVEFTSDNYAVMLHDKTLDRTTDCTGPVSAVTMAQLRECAPHTVVPQLLFWLREAKRLGLSANIEIRNGITAHQMEVVRRTIVAEAPAEVIVSSWYPEPLAMAKAALGDRVKVAPIIAPSGSPFGYSVAEHKAMGFKVIMADYRWMIVDRMHWYADAGIAVHLWTANTANAITRCKALANAEPTTSVIIADDVAKVTGQ